MLRNLGESGAFARRSKVPPESTHARRDEQGDNASMISRTDMPKTPRLPTARRGDRRGRQCLLATLAAACLLGAAGAVAADRMYAWRDPVSGSLQLAGAPPAWYTARAPGPRVRVFEKGQIVDDTAWSDAKRTPPSPVTVAPDSAQAMDPGPPAADPRERLQAFKALLDAWDAAQQAEPAPDEGSTLSAEPAR